ncbi:MAG: GHKL domain-containing protein [Candidatus Coproplasma sp.]
MTDFYFVIDEFRNILSIIAIELVLTLPFMERRRHYLVRLICGITVCLALSSLYVQLHRFIVSSSSLLLITVLSILWYTLILLLTGGLMLLCNKTNLTELVWILITAYAAQHVIYVIVNELICFGIFSNTLNNWIMLLLYVAVAAIIYFIIYKVFVPNMRNRRHLYIQHSMRNCAVLCIFLIVFLCSTFINQASARQDYTKLNYLAAASDFINCALVIVVQYVSLRNSRTKTEKDTLQTLLDNEKKQYDTFKNAVDYVNIKCHDLKHEIAVMQREGNINSARLEEMTKNIAVYESFARTGNETLDILLTDRNLICARKGITLSYMADASGLSVMEATDVYALFGNMLDNAIEYVDGLEDEEKKFIRLFVKNQGNLRVIHQENYFEGNLTFADGLPQTTKEDKNYHGFGTKSMRMIAEKYGGELLMHTDSNLFTVDIVITV